MEEAAVRPNTHLIDHIGLEIDVEGAGNVLARPSLGEERGEAAVAVGAGALRGATIRLDAAERKQLEAET